MVFMLKVITILLLCHLLDANSILDSDPPPPSETALTARYIMHAVDWVTISTISTEDVIKGFPLGNIKSVSDGLLSKGTGIPYFYLTPQDLTGMDLEVDSRCTLMASLAETDYCTRKSYDPQDPKCPRLIIAGHMEKVNNTSDEFKFAQAALFDRHPAMAEWPIAHHFYAAKLNVETIMVLDYQGRGIEFVTPQDYFNANTFTTNYELQKIGL